MTGDDAQFAVAQVLVLAALVTFVVTWLARSSEATCKRLFIAWVLMLTVYGGWLVAFEVVRECDWDQISELFGWCVPCAWVYWYQIGCP